MLKQVNWRVAMVCVAGLWIASEVLLRFAAPSIWFSLPHIEPLSSSLFEDRLDAIARQRGNKKLCLALGDSVFYGSALREKGLRDWAAKTPPAILRELLGPRWVLLDLSADGLEAMDMQAMLQRASRLKPDAVLIELNARMFSEKSGAWPGCMSRPWLGGPEPLKKDFEKLAFERLHDGLTGVSALARYAELAQVLLFEPSAKDVYAAEVNKWMPGDAELDPDILLDMKIRPYYAAPEAAETHLGRIAVAGIAGALKASHVKSLVFLTPQNMNRVSDFLNVPAWKKNRLAFGAPFKKAGLHYEDLADALPAERFLDHCHLDELGNRALAARLMKGLNP